MLFCHNLTQLYLTLYICPNGLLYSLNLSFLTISRGLIFNIILTSMTANLRVSIKVVYSNYLNFFILSFWDILYQYIMIRPWCVITTLVAWFLLRGLSLYHRNILHYLWGQLANWLSLISISNLAHFNNFLTLDLLLKIRPDTFPLGLFLGCHLSFELSQPVMNDYIQLSEFIADILDSILKGRLEFSHCHFIKSKINSIQMCTFEDL